MACQLTISTLSKVCKELKLNNKTVVLTHGAFDILHVGHMSFLEKSKKLGDYLVVGVDSDKRIKKYKGINRPIIPLKQRIEVLLENKSIDFIFSLDKSLDLSNKYFLNLYSKLKPDIVTYGKQFGFQKEMGERKNAFKNIKFKLLNDSYNGIQSTSKIIEELIKQYPY